MRKLTTLTAAILLLFTFSGNAEWPSINWSAPVGSGGSSVINGSLYSNIVNATTVRASAPNTITITGATNATPIVVTAVGHGLLTGDRISISGITGNTNANGYFAVTKLTADTFSLQNYSTGADIAGNGTYGGSPVAVTGIVQAGRVMVGDGTAAQPSIAFASAPGTGMRISSDRSVFYSSGLVAAAFGSATNSLYAPELGLGGGPNVFLNAGTAATLQLGAANSATHAGVAQTLRAQSNITEADQNAPATFTIQAPNGTGTGTSGTLVFQAGTPQNAGTTAHVPATVLTLSNTGSAGTAAPQALFADGTAAKPSISYSSDSDTGLWWGGSGSQVFASNGARPVAIVGAGVSAGSGAQIGWESGASAGGAVMDTILSRGAAATLQLGAANAASPVAQTLQAQGALAAPAGGAVTDVAGANLTIRPGAGTGNATGSSLFIAAPVPTGAGTTAQTQSLVAAFSNSAALFYRNTVASSTDSLDLGVASLAWRTAYLSRATLGSKTKTFTNNTKTGFVTIAVPNSTVATGTIIYEIFVADATNTQAISGELKFSAAANSSGTVTAAPTADAFTPLNPCTSGTLTNAITQTTGANTLTIEFQPNTSLTSTTREIHYRINSPGTMTITPL